MKLRWPGFLLIAAILVMWGVSSCEKWLDPVSFPRVSVIFASWMRMGGELIEHMLSLLKMQFGAIEGRDKGVSAPAAIEHGDARRKILVAIGADGTGRVRDLVTTLSPLAEFSPA